MKDTNAIFEYDLSMQCALICGIDEAGRGSLAGPVVSAAVIMPLKDSRPIDGIFDSKLVKESERERLYDEITKNALAYAICEVSQNEIDKINILNATKKSMKLALSALSICPELVLVDAVRFESDIPLIDIVKGDQKSYSIAAASILAKVTRDRIMREYDKAYPNYSFADHKGYATKKHYEALKAFGACKLHRMSFLKNFFERQQGESNGLKCID